MNRRDFIKSTIVASAATALPVIVIGRDYKITYMSINDWGGRENYTGMAISFYHKGELYRNGIIYDRRSDGVVAKQSLVQWMDEVTGRHHD